ncbi:autotransporter-associated beta strand repeat-containing protein [Methylorubrum zatmanii]
MRNGLAGMERGCAVRKTARQHSGFILALFASTALVAVPAALAPFGFGEVAAAAGGAGGVGDGSAGGDGGASNASARGAAGNNGRGTSGGGGGGGAGTVGGNGGSGASGGAGGSGGSTAGGQGGQGGDSAAAGGGGGGGGGAHGYVGSAQPTQQLSGGAGGAGGGGNINGGGGGGGGGGAGGYGLVFTGSSADIQYNVLGGAGGAGGNAAGSAGDGGAGGDGGYGILVDGQGGGVVTLAISGSTIVRGGDGGEGGLGQAAGNRGAGGIGISGANLALTLAAGATVEGGQDSGGRANAIQFTGGNNVLELRGSGGSSGQTYATITGNVLGVRGYGESTTLKLGGAGGVFDLTKLAGDTTAGAQFQKMGAVTVNTTGTWVVTGTPAGSTGSKWTVDGGTLQIGTSATSGTLVVSDNVNVNGGTILATAGAAAAVSGGGVMADSGGTIKLRAVAGSPALTIGGGSFGLLAGSTFDVTLGAPTTTALVDAQFNLSYKGALVIASNGSLNEGSYTLVKFGNIVAGSGNGFTSISGPTDFGYTVTLDSTNKQLLLQVVGSGLYWNGTTTSGSTGPVAGGDGTWSATSGGVTNWTNAGGTNRVASDPAKTAIFAGTAGTVSVDNSQGTVQAKGLKFVTSGYIIGGGTLTLASGSAVPRISVDGAATLATIDAPLASTAGLEKVGAGTLTLTGTSILSGSLAVSAGTLALSGEGKLTTDGYDTVGDAAGSTAAVTVSGAGSRWTSTNGIMVGVSGTGSVTVSGGATVTSGALHLGRLTGGNGTVTVDGAGSAWTSTGPANVGYDGTGQMTLSNGAAVEVSALQVAVTSGSSGTLLVESGATLTSNGSAGYIGNQATATGQATVTGTGSRWTSSQHLYVGLSGSGSLTLSSGGSASVLSLDAGLNGGAQGTVLVESGGSLAVTGLLTAGNSTGATGGITVTGGRSALTADTLSLGNGGSATLSVAAGGTVTLTAGSLSAAGGSGGAATVTVSGTGSRLKATGGMSLGTGAGSTSALTVQGGATLETVSGGLYLEGGSVTTVAGAGSALLVGTLHPGTPDSFAASDGWFSLGRGTATVSNGARLEADGVYVQGAPAGAASLTVTGAGTVLDGHLVLYVGGNGNGTAGNGSLTIEDGATASASVFGAAIDPGTTGTLLLTGTGSSLTTIPHGTFLGNVYAGSFGNGLIVVRDGATLSAANQLRIGYFAGSTGELAIGAKAGDPAAAAAGTVSAANGITFGAGAGTITFNHTSSAYELGSTISGAGTIGVLAGTTILTGDASGFTGTTAIASGATLQIGRGGGTGLFAGAVTDNGALVFDRSDASTFAGAISGSGTLTKSGAGTLTLTGTNTYAGGTMVTAGTLVVGNGATAGSITGAIANSGALVFDRSDAVTYGGVISDTGTVEKRGAGTLTLSGTNTYTGATLVSAGTLSVESASGLGASSAGTTVASGATLLFYSRLAPFVNQTYAEALTLSGDGLNGTGALRIDAVNDDSTVTLTGPITLVGDTRIRTGDGASRMARIVDLTGAVTGANTTLTIDAAERTTLSGNLSLGSGGLVKNGRHDLTLSGNNSFSGTTTINAGSLIVTNSAALGDASGSVVVNDGALALYGLNGPVAIGAKSLTLTASSDYDGAFYSLQGDNSYAGPITLAGNSRISAFNGSLTLSGGIGGAGKNLVFATDASATLIVSGAIATGSGSVAFTEGGTAILTAANTYTGGTAVGGGTLQIGNGGTSGSIAGDVVTKYQGTAGTLAFNRSDAVTYAGVISGSGALEQKGPGTLTLTGTNTYTGLTTVSGGTLRIGDGGTAGAIAGDIQDDAAVVFDRADDVAFLGSINGTGTLEKKGAGTLTLSSLSSPAGGTTVSAGTLRLSGGQLGGGVAVRSGAAIEGDPTVSAATLTGPLTLNGGATLRMQAGGTTALSVDALAMNPGALLAATLGTPSATAPVSVSGALALNGTLNLITGAGYTTGTYRLFDYGGALTGAGLTLGTAPAHNLFAVDTATGGKVDLIAAAGQWWNGTTTSSGGTRVVGGSGTWDVGGSTTNWTDVTGVSAAFWAQNGLAIFAGQAGTVTLNGASIARVAGIELLTSGYVLTGDPIRLTGFQGNPVTRILVQDDAVSGGGSATIASVLRGGQRLEKIGGGTLVLSGDNTYSGGTTVTAGTLQVGNGGTSGTIQGDVIDNAALVFDRSDAVTFAGAISGTGSLEKRGAGTLTLSGPLTYAGTTTIAGGTLRLTDETVQGLLPNSASVINNATLVIRRDSLPAGGLYTGVISGSGSLVKEGSQMLFLTGANTYTGGTTISGGQLIVGGAVPGNTGSIVGDVVNNGVLSFNRTGAVTFAGAISGSGAVGLGGGLTLTLTGSNTYSGRTVLQGSTLVVGDGGSAGSITADVETDFNGANSGRLVFDRADGLTYAGAVSGSGTLEKRGAGTLTLTGTSTLSGGTTITAGTLRIGAGGTAGSVAGSIANSGTLVFDRSDDLVAGGAITGSGTLVKRGSGSLTLTGANSAGAGTTVAAGTLTLTSGTRLDGDVTVQAGATLAGLSGGVSPVVGGAVTVQDRATLRSAPTANAGVYGLAVDRLSLAANATLAVTLGSNTGNAVISAGTLALGGRLDVSDGGGMALGLYRILDYTTLAADAGLRLGTTPLTYAYEIQRQPGQVNLAVLNGDILYWNGTATSADGTVHGGSGTWSNDPARTNWTTTPANQARAWNGSFAVFGTTGGSVAVDPANGPVAVTGAQFMVDGYAVTGGGITLAAPSGRTQIRVGDGTPAGGAYVARVFAPLGGTTGLEKTDLGTLILGGANTYTGGTLISGGTLQIGDGGTSGSIQGDVTNNATLAFDRADDTAFAGAISGSGALVKRGAGTLTLAGTNSHAGGTTVAEGALRIAAAGALGSGALALQGQGLLQASASFSDGRAVSLSPVAGQGGGGVAVDGGETLTLSGVLSGTGALTKSGSGTLRLAGANIYTGATTVASGRLEIAGGASLSDSAALTVAAGAGLSLTDADETVGSLFGGGGIALNGHCLTASGGAFSGSLSGSGCLTKRGAGTLTLTGSSSQTGPIAVAEGTVQVTGAAALGSGALALQGAGTLRASATFSDGRAISLTPVSGQGGGTVAVDDSQTLTLTGVIAGLGNLAKTGTGTLVLAGTGDYAGATAVTAGTLIATGGRAIGDTSAVSVAEGARFILRGDEAIGSLAGAGSVVLDGASLSTGGGTTFAGALSGSGGLVKTGSGTLTLSGANTYAGDTRVRGGGLAVSGSVDGDIYVENAATLSGGGRVGKTVHVLDGGTLAGAPGAGLTMGGLDLAGKAALAVMLGAPSSAGVFQVNGDVRLGGTLAVTPATGFGFGVYRILNYTGRLTDTGMSVSALPNGLLGGVQSSVANQVNLFVEDPNSPVAFWNGSSTRPAQTVVGGSGTWSADARTNWTNASGTINRRWPSGFAVFQGTPGTVTVDASAGAVQAGGMQFADSGYVVTGGAITLTGAQAAIRVGDGTAAGAASVATIASALTGTAGLEKSDLGTLILTGANTYTGGTAIKAGRLQIGQGGTSGSIVGNVTDNATLAFNRSDIATFGGTISGSGRVVQAGTGTTVLTGANTYTGGTTISAGTLQLGQGGTSGSVVGDVTDNATLAFTRSDVVSFSGTISGSGRVVQAGTGTTVLTGTNSYSGGTAITAGTLRVGADAALGAGGGGISLDGGTLAASASFGSGRSVSLGGAGGTVEVMAAADTLTLSGDLAGTGGLTKSGSGTLLLLGTGRYAGRTTVSAGTLQIGNGGSAGVISGEVVNNARLVFNRSDTYAFQGNITGSGEVSFLGGGRVLFTATEAYTGPVAVTETMVRLDPGSATTSPFTIQAGGVLGGTATIGGLTINGGGTAAPGYSPGTLTVTGPVAFNAGALYAVDVTPDGQHDLITATGPVTLSSQAAVQVHATPGRYAPTARYTILTTTATLTGRFGTVTSDYAFLDPVLSYDAQNVYLGLTYTGRTFAEYARSRNQYAVAVSAQGLGAGNRIHDTLMTLPEGGGVGFAFDQLSGEVHPSINTVIQQQAIHLRDAVGARLRQAGPAGALTQAARGAGPVTQELGIDLAPTLWAQAFGGVGQRLGGDNAASVSNSIGGMLGGIDVALGEGIRAGVIGGVSQSSFDLNARASSGGFTNYSLGLYAGGAVGPFSLSGGVAQSWHDVSALRSVTFAGFSGSNSSRETVGSTQVFGEAAYDLSLGAYAVQPFAGLAYVDVNAHAVREGGIGGAALTGTVRGQGVGYTSLGLRAATLLTLGEHTLTPSLTLGWQHALGEVVPTASLLFSGAVTPFSIAGLPVERDMALVGAGLAYEVSDVARIQLNYTGQIGARASQNTFAAQYSLRF